VDFDCACCEPTGLKPVKIRFLMASLTESRDKRR